MSKSITLRNNPSYIVVEIPPGLLQREHQTGQGEEMKQMAANAVYPQDYCHNWRRRCMTGPCPSDLMVRKLDQLEIECRQLTGKRINRNDVVRHLIDQCSSASFRGL